jgi:hypothetical protein
VKRLGSRKGRRRDGIGGADAEQELTMTDEVLTDFTVEELREFLDGDLLEVPVDPGFKERLKRRLWELVQEQARQRKQRPDS